MDRGYLQGRKEMTALKGILVIKRTFLAHAWKPVLILSGSMVLTGCVHWPDIASECEQYGVMESNQPMGQIVHLQPLYRDQLDVVCADVKDATAKINPDAQISGCAISKDDGSVNAYYWVGDKCAMNHELCHAIHGAEHTERYLQELKIGMSRPYCPANQLKLAIGTG